MKKIYYSFVCVLLLETLASQVVPYSPTPVIDKNIADIIHINNDTAQSIRGLSKIIQFERSEYIFNLKVNSYPENITIYIFDENNASAGPYYFNESYLATNPFTCRECYILIDYENQELPIEVELLSITHPIPVDTSTPIPYKKNDIRENPTILVTGFWPPTNEMIRHFSQNENLNTNGWQGDDWEGRGYDIVSYFPEFESPDCDNCGIGYGDFEVDYQDTSQDYWPIVNELNPIAIITFSRGFIDHSWEMEFNFYNRTNWYGDYETPTLPTPNPPDESVANYFIRHSTLPVENLVSAIDNANIGLDPYIDWNGNPGQFVSEFMGYHGVWYKDTHSFGGDACVIAGHIHVGGLIDWDTARQASEISIREIIDYVDQFSYTSGDINDDEVIDVLDIVILVNAIMGTTDLTTIQTYAADLNGDSNINIQDIILTINLILS